MALKSGNITMTGSKQTISAGLSLTGASASQMVCYLRLENPTGNAAVVVGDTTLTATIYGFSIAAAATGELGPFGGGTSPINLNEVNIIGTNAQILHVTYVIL